MSLIDQNVYSFMEGRNYPSSQNYARFELITDFTAGGAEPMVLKSTDVLAGNKRFQKVLVRQITAAAYLPICAATPPPGNIFSSSPLVALYHTYRFPMKINDMATVFEAAFVQNADRQTSRDVYTQFEHALTLLEVSAERDFIDPKFQGAGINVALSLIIEFLCFT